ncbi:hypothetical protein PGA94_09375 [Pediococcus pentosaceus]|uniref:hypothetical protein n=1 Tax=Pediococcus pentosaceus TaxID=1255 RepID=UPI00232F3B60|nr:hypothetical protein [Pediococcus pentosaceus]MDB1562983.1 hypothetical protein [Pediococcus pentosaceus]
MKLYVLAWDGIGSDDIVEGIFTTIDKAVDVYKQDDDDLTPYHIYEVDTDIPHDNGFEDCVSWDPEVLLHPDDPFTI